MTEVIKKMINRTIDFENRTVDEPLIEPLIFIFLTTFVVKKLGFYDISSRNLKNY
ncbi:hypothetical protein DFQ02_106255 [Seonamhaeicola aphaedonensis]|uniref:Uncharacterized protein n=1 Tax=Seonamhaeicola aphaedonensis TaxID=1461338 RepID=A0A3D9HF77_9FLAO|nr:hypothetical protein DFQ02_106255 [Seonamhaeicola aphaedonensis]